MKLFVALLALTLPGCLTLTAYEGSQRYLRHVADPRPPETVARVLGCVAPVGSQAGLTLRVALTDRSTWDLRCALSRSSGRWALKPLGWSRVGPHDPPLQAGRLLLATFRPLPNHHEGPRRRQPPPLGAPVHPLNKGLISASTRPLTRALRSRAWILNVHERRVSLTGPRGAPFGKEAVQALELGRAGPGWEVPRGAASRRCLVRSLMPLAYAATLALDLSVIGGPVGVAILDWTGLARLGPWRS